MFITLDFSMLPCGDGGVRPHDEYVTDFFCTDPAGCAEEDVDKKCMHIKTALSQRNCGDRVVSVQK